jgi:hypothetical protein
MTQGCRWQEKSFNVAVNNGIVIDRCQKCQQELYNVLYRRNGYPYCKDCFSAQAPLKRVFSDTEGFFYTSKDKLFEFTAGWFKKDIEIRSKGQWKRFMKQHGLHDDIKQSPRKENEFIPDKDIPVSREKIATMIHEELKEKELHDKLIKRRS